MKEIITQGQGFIQALDARAVFVLKIEFPPPDLHRIALTGGSGGALNTLVGVQVAKHPGSFRFLSLHKTVLNTSELFSDQNLNTKK